MVTAIKGNDTSTFGGNIDVTGNVVTDAPAFSAYSTTTTSFSNATYTKVRYDIEDYDTDSCFDTSNYRFTPTVAGYYQINGVMFCSSAASGLSYLTLYKNGSRVQFGSGITLVGGPILVLSALVYLNGSTDYVELFGYQNSGGSLVGGSNQASLKFQGYLVRAV